MLTCPFNIWNMRCVIASQRIETARNSQFSHRFVAGVRLPPSMVFRPDIGLIVTGDGGGPRRYSPSGHSVVAYEEPGCWSTTSSSCDRRPRPAFAEALHAGLYWALKAVPDEADRSATQISADRAGASLRVPWGIAGTRAFSRSNAISGELLIAFQGPAVFSPLYGGRAGQVRLLGRMCPEERSN